MSLCASGGIHEPIDAVKALMSGATGVQVVSALLQHGPRRLGVLLDGLSSWLQEHEYTSVKQLSGSMNLVRCPDPSGYERANYVKLLQSWHGK